MSNHELNDQVIILKQYFFIEPFCAVTLIEMIVGLVVTSNESE